MTNLVKIKNVKQSQQACRFLIREKVQIGCRIFVALKCPEVHHSPRERILLNDPKFIY